MNEADIVRELGPLPECTEEDMKRINCANHVVGTMRRLYAKYADDPDRLLEMLELLLRSKVTPSQTLQSACHEG